MKQSFNRIAGNLATIFFAIAIVIQILLAAGILPISMAWGGTQQELTGGLRVASVIAAAVLFIFAYVIRRRAGLQDDKPPSRVIKVLSWLITAFLFLNTLGNFASQSQAERLILGPISLVLAASCLVVSLSTDDS